MTRTGLLIGLAVIGAGAPAIANHVNYTDVPFASRGACEAQRNALSNGDDFLLDTFPDLFSSEGEVRSFLNKAFPCEIHASDGQWYITDDRVEVLGSRWFEQRNH